MLSTSWMLNIPMNNRPHEIRYSTFAKGAGWRSTGEDTSVDGLIYAREAEANAVEWRRRAERAEAMVSDLSCPWHQQKDRCWRSPCNNDICHPDPKHFTFCPFCGKPILFVADPNQSKENSPMVKYLKFEHPKMSGYLITETNETPQDVADNYIGDDFEPGDLEAFVIQEVEMTKDEFENLPEYSG